MKIKRYLDFTIEAITPNEDSWLSIPKSPKGNFSEAPVVNPNDVKDIKINFELFKQEDTEELYRVILSNDIVKKYPFLGDYSKETDHDKQ